MRSQVRHRSARNGPHEESYGGVDNVGGVLFTRQDRARRATTWLLIGGELPGHNGPRGVGFNDLIR